jgi:hypothetical protein
MEKALNYRFNRRSANHLEWLYYVVKSEKFYKADAVIIMRDIKNSYLPTVESVL